MGRRGDSNLAFSKSLRSSAPSAGSRVSTVPQRGEPSGGEPKPHKSLRGLPLLSFAILFDSGGTPALSNKTVLDSGGTPALSNRIANHGGGTPPLPHSLLTCVERLGAPAFAGAHRVGATGSALRRSGDGTTYVGLSDFQPGPGWRSLLCARRKQACRRRSVSWSAVAKQSCAARSKRFKAGQFF